MITKELEQELKAAERQEQAQPSAEDIKAALHQCTGTLAYHRATMLPLASTDGAVMMAELCRAFWLLDAVASYQIIPKIRRESLQVWTLTVNRETKTAELVGTDGNLHVLARQKIGHTDFPLDKMVLYVEDSGDGFKVILLPSEH